MSVTRRTQDGFGRQWASFAEKEMKKVDKALTISIGISYLIQ
jgi:hypothetical protein